ncbi:MAG: YfhO family protein [Acidobacteria bacterium]|nr:YfhO family protein [Acidobacteriota bacterium]
MLALAAYLLFAVLLVGSAARWVTPIPRRIALCLVLLPLLFTGPAFLAGRVWAPADLGLNAVPYEGVRAAFGVTETAPGIYTDVGSQIAPWRAAMLASWRAGEWPLWNPYQLCGDPLAGTAQAAPYYPLYLLALWLPLPLFLGVQAALALLVAALAGWLFLRELDLGVWPALAGAAGWAFSGFVLFWIHWPLGVTAAWLPLVALGGRRAVREPGVRSALLLTVTLLCVLLAGHPETAFHVIVAGAFWTAGEWFLAPPRRPGRSLATGLGAGLVALLLAAIYLLPILEVMPQTRELGLRAELLARRESAPWPDAARHLLVAAVPFAFGSPREPQLPVPLSWRLPGTAYAGSLLVPLALLGLGAGRDPRRWVFAVLLLLGLGAGVGAPGVSDLLARLPLFSLVLNDRLWFVAAWALTALAAIGLEVAGEVRSRWLPPLALGWTAALTLAVALLAGPLLLAGFSKRGLALQTAALLAPPALLALTARRLPGRARFAVAALLLLLAQRRVEMGGLFPAQPRAAFYPPVAPLDRIAADPGLFRVVGERYALVPATATHHRLEDVRGYQALNFLRFYELAELWSERQPVWFNRVDDLENPFLDFLGVRWAVTDPGGPVPAGWEIVDELPNARLLRNREELPRATVPSRVRLVPHGMVTREEMATATELAAVAWIEEAGAARPEATVEEANGPGRVEIARRASGAYHLRTDLERESWVVVAETAWAGWRALSGRRELPLAFANHAFLALRVPAGRSEIELVYRPRGFVAGRAVSFGTLAFLLGVAGSLRLQRRLHRVVR